MKKVTKLPRKYQSRESVFDKILTANETAGISIYWNELESGERLYHCNMVGPGPDGIPAPVTVCFTDFHELQKLIDGGYQFIEN